MEKSRVVVSFTTIPSRIGKIEPLLKSLSKQTYKPDAVYMWLCSYYKRKDAKFSVDDIPSFVRDYKFVSIMFSDDYGPFSKLVGTLQVEKEPDTIIVTADDDYKYPRLWLEGLVEFSEKNPNCAVAYRGRMFGRGGWSLSYNKTTLASCPKEVKKVEIITGVMGAAYRRRFFTDEAALEWSRVVQGECPAMFLNDDIWISGNLAKNKIKRLVVPAKNRMPEMSAVDALWDINSTSSNNDDAIKYFEKYWQPPVITRSLVFIYHVFHNRLRLLCKRTAHSAGVLLGMRGRS